MGSLDDHIEAILSNCSDFQAAKDIQSAKREASSASSQIVARHKKAAKVKPSVDDQKQRDRRRKVARFLDDEAELGSDDENNDDARKRINKNDAEENEDGLDADLEGFVVKGGDDEVIGDAEDDMLKKFQEDLTADDKARTRAIMQAAIFGHQNNKKRKRGEVAGLDDDQDDDHYLRR